MSELLELRKLCNELKIKVDRFEKIEVHMREVSRLQDLVIDQYEQKFRTGRYADPEPVSQCKGALVIAFKRN